MSRRDEAESVIEAIDTTGHYVDEYASDFWSLIEPLEDLARTLADEVDTITADRDEWKRRVEAMADECIGARDVCARTIEAIAEGRDNG